MKIGLAILGIFAVFWGSVLMASETNTIRTYMAFGVPLDPAHVKTLVDLDLSYALASTLVDWNDSKNLGEALATPGEVENEKEISFTLKDTAKWSDGTRITADQAVGSFERAKKIYGDELKSLFESVESISATDEKTVLFKLNGPTSKTQLIHKLTEPMYGIVFVDKNGKANFSKSSGPYILKKETAKELELSINPHWYAFEKGMVEKILIRQPLAIASDEEQGAFSSDPWPNLLSSSSLMPDGVAKIYERNHFSVWNRNLDRVFFLSPSQRNANVKGRKLLLALNQKLSREVLMRGLAGYHLSQQFFPPGYIIYDDDFKLASNDEIVPSDFKKKPLELLAAHGRLSAALKQNLSDSIASVVGIAPMFRYVPLSDFEKERAAGHYDLFVGTLSVSDPNLEGAVSFFFGMNPPLIPNSGPNDGDFVARTAKARSWAVNERNAEYKKVFTKAVQDGCILPLFHFSSVAIARDGLDLSRVPTTDETVSFAKVRFK